MYNRIPSGDVKREDDGRIINRCPSCNGVMVWGDDDEGQCLRCGDDAYIDYGDDLDIDFMNEPV